MFLCWMVVCHCLNNLASRTESGYLAGHLRGKTQALRFLVLPFSQIKINDSNSLLCFGECKAATYHHCRGVWLSRGQDCAQQTDMVEIGRVWVYGCDSGCGSIALNVVPFYVLGASAA